MTIQQVLRPFFVICFVMGVGFYLTKQEKPRIRWSTYLSILYFFIIWFIYAYIFYYTITLFTWKFLFGSDIGIVLINIDIFITAISVFRNFYYQKVQLYFLYFYRVHYIYITHLYIYIYIYISFSYILKLYLITLKTSI